MIPEAVFRAKLNDVANCLPGRDGSTVETLSRWRTYYRHLGTLETDVFIEACDRIIYGDEWFPTVARIRIVADDCRAERARSQRAHAGVRPIPPLVCPYCAGARWVRIGGVDPPNMHAGADGSRCQPCPGCTTDGRYDAERERGTIRDEGGVPNPEGPREVDLGRITWPRELAALRDPATGRIDLEALYRRSRILRGLDPDGDDRPRPVPGFRTIGQSAARVAALVPVEDDDVPF